MTTTKTLFDRAGDALTLSTGHPTARRDEVTIHVRETFQGREHAAAVHVSSETLHAMLDEITPEREPRGPRDHGPTPAAYECESGEAPLCPLLHSERGRAEQGRSKAWERLEALERDLAAVEEKRDRWRDIAQERADDLERLRAELSSRPLAAADITDEMVGRALTSYDKEAGSRPRWDRMRHALRDALTEPATRPEGAEEVEGVLRTLDDPDGPVEPPTLNDQQFTRLADLLAARGVRVVTEEER